MKNAVLGLVVGLCGLFLVGCATVTPGPDTPPVTPPAFATSYKQFHGWGNVNYWMKGDPELLAQVLSENHCNATEIEFIGDIAGHYENNPSALYEPIKKYVAAMRAKGIVTVINIWNWNSTYICQSKISESQFNGIVDFFVNEVGTEGVVLQAASEWADARNTECAAKAKKFCDILNAKWKGMRSYNKGSRPTSSWSGCYPEYHIRSCSSVPANVLVLTDCGSVLKELGGFNGYTKNLDKLGKLVKDSKKKNNGFIHYAYQIPDGSIDEAAIKVIGASWGE